MLGAWGGLFGDRAIWGGLGEVSGGAQGDADSVAGGGGGGGGVRGNAGVGGQEAWALHGTRSLKKWGWVDGGGGGKHEKQKINMSKMATKLPFFAF